MNHYKSLGLDPAATAEEIKAAYKAAAQKEHPDRHDGSKEAIDRFQVIQEAYAVLGDKAKRQRYDETGESKAGPDPDMQAKHDLASLFSQLFEQGDFRQKDYVAIARDQIIVSQQHLTDQIKVIHQKLPRVEALLACVKGDMMEGPLNEKINMLKLGLEKNKELQLMHERMLILIHDYEVTGQTKPEQITLQTIAGGQGRTVFSDNFYSNSGTGY